MNRTACFRRSGGLRHTRRKEKPSAPRILRLSLNKAPFEVMLTGEKWHEYRRPSQWITSRLLDKATGQPRAYDLVEFTNGYGADRPRFYAPYLGFVISDHAVERGYSNGLKVTIQVGDYIIRLGPPQPFQP